MTCQKTKVINNLILCTLVSTLTACGNMIKSPHQDSTTQALVTMNNMKELPRLNVYQAPVFEAEPEPETKTDDLPYIERAAVAAEATQQAIAEFLAWPSTKTVAGGVAIWWGGISGLAKVSWHTLLDVGAQMAEKNTDTQIDWQILKTQLVKSGQTNQKNIDNFKRNLVKTGAYQFILQGVKDTTQCLKNFKSWGGKEEACHFGSGLVTNSIPDIE